jgi:hypothetical protein
MPKSSIAKKPRAPTKPAPVLKRPKFAQKHYVDADVDAKCVKKVTDDVKVTDKKREVIAKMHEVIQEAFDVGSPMYFKVYQHFDRAAFIPYVTYYCKRLKRCFLVPKELFCTPEEETYRIALELTGEEVPFLEWDAFMWLHEEMFEMF